MFLDLAWDRIEKIDTIVCERFIINARTAKLTQSPWSLEQIGALRFMCKKFDIKFVLQNAADAKRFATDDKFSKLGWKRPQGDGHARDAQRHLLVYLIQTGELDPALLLRHDA